MDETVVGIDVGATLAKLAVRGPRGKLECSFIPSSDANNLVEQVKTLAPRGVGLTGCGARRLQPHLPATPQRVGEYEAWARGSRELIRAQGLSDDRPYALVSLGTGTSVSLVQGEQVDRLGGTALGGGTLLGLGFALTGCRSYGEFCELAQGGERSQVDLLIQDIYSPGEIDIPGAGTAAAFGRLARIAADTERAAPTDPPAPLASAVTHLVAENVALMAVALVKPSPTRRIVFGGSALSENPRLQAILAGVTAAMGFEPILLEDGPYTGAIGALHHAASAADALGQNPNR